MLFLASLIVALAFFAWFLYVWVPDAITRSQKAKHAEIMREPWEPGYRGKG